MTVAIVYIYPPNAGPQYVDYALRFVKSYNENPPAIAHDSIIVLNGCRRTTEIECLFSSLQNVKFLEHDNSGYDIGGFQAASRQFPADLMVFFGNSTYFKRPGWLLRMLQAKIKHGEALYGGHGNRGVSFYHVHPHVRSTGFWLSSALMNQYPMRVTRADQRYAWEHGPACLTSWVYKRGLKVWLVSWSGEYEWKDWDSVPNGYHKGDQSALLFGDRLTEPPHHPVP
jgi:hypothetical protein